MLGREALESDKQTDKKEDESKSLTNLEFCKKITFFGNKKSFHTECQKICQASPSKRPSSELKQSSDIFLENFIIAEAHGDIASKKFFCENAHLFKEMGYEILFMEHLFFDMEQDDLDYFFITGIMSDKLKRKLKYLDRIFYIGGGKAILAEWKKYNFTAIVQAARKAGICVVAIDISYVYALQFEGYKEGGKNARIYEMNYTAYHIIQRELKNTQGKWIAFMGNAHAALYRGIPGIADLMGVRTIFIDQDNEKTKTEIICNTKYEVTDSLIITTKEEIAIFYTDILIYTPFHLSLSEIIPPLAYSKKTSSLPIEEKTTGKIERSVKIRLEHENKTAIDIQKNGHTIAEILQLTSLQKDFYRMINSYSTQSSTRQNAIQRIDSLFKTLIDDKETPNRLNVILGSLIYEHSLAVTEHSKRWIKKKDESEFAKNIDGIFRKNGLHLLFQPDKSKPFIEDYEKYSSLITSRNKI